MKSIFIRLIDERYEEADPLSMDLEWVVLDDQSQVVQEGGSSLAELKQELQASDLSDFAQTVLFLPDVLALFTQVTVPGRTIAQIRRALPFAVESYVTTDIDAMHIAYTTVHRGRPIDCVAISKEILQTILSAFRESGVEPTHCSTIGMQVPLRENAVSLVLHDNDTWIRTAEQLIAIELTSLPMAIESLLEEHPENGEEQSESEIAFHVMKHVDIQSPMNLLLPTKNVEVVDFDSSILVYAARQFTESVPINLLQGEFAVANDNVVDFKPWVKTSAWAAVVFLAYLGMLTVEGAWARFQVHALDSEAAELYTSIYDVDPGVQSPMRQMRAHIGGQRAATEHFNVLLGHLANAIDTSGTNVSINSLNFRSSQRTLTTEMELPTFEMLDSIKKSLELKPVAVDINSAEQVSGRWRANLTIELNQ